LILSPAKKRRARRNSKKLFHFLRDVVNEFLTDNCPHLAASISYYTLFCLFPLTLAAIAILGWLTSDPNVESKVIDADSDFLPESSGFTTKTIQSINNSWEATGVVAIIGLLWGGSAIFNATRKALNAAWGVWEPRPFFVDRFLELCMMMGLGVLLLTSLGVTAALSVVRKYSSDTVDNAFVNGDFLWNAALILVTAGLAFVTFLLLFKFIPNTKVRWSDVWGGALMAAIGFEGAKQLFVWYTTNHSLYNAVYGTMGALIALMVWIYVSAFIMLLCAKMTSVYSRSRMIEEPPKFTAVEETSDTAIYPGSWQASVEDAHAKGGRMIGDALPSFSSVSWLGPVGVSRRDIRRKLRYRTGYGHSPKTRRNRKY
jgi:membrane protein